MTVIFLSFNVFFCHLIKYFQFWIVIGVKYLCDFIFCETRKIGKFWKWRENNNYQKKIKSLFHGKLETRYDKKNKRNSNALCLRLKCLIYKKPTQEIKIIMTEPISLHDRTSLISQGRKYLPDLSIETHVYKLVHDSP